MGSGPTTAAGWWPKAFEAEVRSAARSLDAYAVWGRLWPKADAARPRREVDQALAVAADPSAAGQVGVAFYHEDPQVARDAVDALLQATIDREWQGRREA